MSDFVHLHNHTDYSLLDGAAPISRYIEKAKSCGMTSLALTDHGNMYGAIKFYQACKAAELNPIIGTEFYIAPDSRFDKNPSNKYYHLILLAMNDRGYHNIMELNSIGWVEGFYYRPRIDRESLKAHSEGVICLSACLAGEIPQAILQNRLDLAQETISWYKDVFGDRYYIEIQDHDIAEEKQVLPILVELARKNNIKIVATNDIHYIEKSDANAHDVLLCIGTARKKEETNRFSFSTQEFYFKTPEEMKELFKDYPEAISNTLEVASRCQLEIKFPGPLLPIFPYPKDKYNSEDEYLIALAREGLKNRYKEITETLTTRLEYELGIITKMGFSGYFLIVRDYIFWAKSQGIPVGPGRGSGAGSLVAYCVDITDVEPMEYNLLFERFLNPERISMPDFDIDFCFERRTEVIEHVTELYGKDSVSQIATFGTLKAKAVLKDCARVLNIPFAESNEICKYIVDDPEKPGKDVPIAKALELSPELKAIADRGGVYAELFDVASRLQGLNRHISMHAAGVVIGHSKLSDYVPLYKDPKTGIVTTQYTMDVIEECGLVKMDFLGLKTLTLIKHAEELVQKIEPGFEIKDISLKDPLTYQLFGNGDTTCVFQFESPGMQKFLRQLKPTQLEEIVAMNALYRPGPMDNIPAYIEAKNDHSKIVYPDPDLKGILETTYGIIVYQEQVMQVAQIFSGFTLGQADMLRKIMGKKKVDLLAGERVKFVEGAIKKGRDRKKAEDLFTSLEPFARYGFNKSHSVAYAVIAYQTAYLKAHYPSQFMAANLTNEAGSPDKFIEYLGLCKKMGIKILPPNVNHSNRNFNVVNNDIVYGLSGIKGLGDSVINPIIAEREKNGPYKDFMDFLKRTDSKIQNSKCMEALILSGAFDYSGVNRQTLMNNYQDAITFVKNDKLEQESGQLQLFDFEDIQEQATFEMIKSEDYSFLEKLEYEKQLLGVYISGHPLEIYQEVYDKCVHINLADPDSIPIGKTVSVIGMVKEIKEITTKRATKMAKITIADFNGTASLTIFTKLWDQIYEIIKQDEIYAFRGEFSSYNDQVSMTVNDFYANPNELLKTGIHDLFIEFNRAETSVHDLNKAMDFVRGNLGKVKVHLSLAQTTYTEAEADTEKDADRDTERDIDSEGEEMGPICKTTYTNYLLGNDFSVSYDQELVNALNELPFVNKAWYE